MLVLYSAVKFMIVLRRGELKQKLFDLIIDGVVSEQFIVSGVVDFFCENFAKIMEGIEGFVLQTFMYFFENISIVQVVDGSVELEANEVSGLKALHAFENFSLVDLMAEDYL